MNEAEPQLSEALQLGLRAAFGAPASAPSPSVLRVLQGRAGSQLGVHLSEGGEQAPEEPSRAGHTPSRTDPGVRYQMLGEIGRGGMGIVYKGRDADLGRDVAMKVLLKEHAGNPAALARFVEEAQIGGQLQHPGIVPVYELGLHQGEEPYFAMKFIQGATLTEILRQRADPVARRPELLRMFEQVCQAMAYAHARGVVHRDLKPSNVMIGAFGEVQVVDWGFAKVLQERAVATGPRSDATAQPPAAQVATVRTQSGSTRSVAGSILGTPAYMPPEQALGDVAHLGFRSDVFSLGAILCEILTGSPPYRAQEGELIGQAARAELGPAHQRLLQSGADAMLLELCRECLAAAPESRPGSAQQVADRIHDYLSSVEERVRQAQVHAAAARVRARATLVLSAVVILVLLLAGGAWLWLEQAASSRRARATQQVADALRIANESAGASRAGSAADLAPWDRAVAAAEQAAALARHDDVDADARARATSLLTAVTEERGTARHQHAQWLKDRATHEQLVELRIPSDDDVRAKGWPEQEARRLDAAYAEALTRHLDGTSTWSELPDTQVQDELSRSGIAIELAAALDHWAMIRDQLAGTKTAPAPELTARLRQFALRLDPDDPWRNQLRLLLPSVTKERAAIVRLAGEADLATLPALSVVLLGEALWQGGAVDAAVDVYRRGQELYPDDFGICFRLGVTLESLPAPEDAEAVTFYRLALALRPDMREVRHRLGLTLHKQGDDAASERLFLDLVRSDPDSAHWRSHLGDAQKRQHKWDQAIANYQRCLELDPGYPEGHVTLGQALYGAHRVDEAMANLRRALELDANSYEAHNGLGQVLADQDDLEGAVRCCRRALELKPDFAGAHTNLGYALQQQGKLDAAVQSHRRALELDPRCANAHSNLGLVLYQQGKLDEAIACHRRAIELNPRLARAHRNLGNALLRQGNVEEAIACERRAVALGPEDPFCHFSLGLSLQQAGRLEDALGSFERSFELGLRGADVCIGIGDSLLGLQRIDEAIASYRRAVEFEPTRARAHAVLGEALGGARQLDEAVASLQRALELEPGRPYTRTNLGITLVRLGKPEEAMACFRGEIELHPALPGAFFHLAWIRATAADTNLRDVEEAVRLANQAVELVPNDRAAWCALGVALYRKGDLEASADALARALTAKTLGAAAGLFLAMAQHRLGDAELAKSTFESATLAMKQKTEGAEELNRFRAEAAQVLGIEGAGK